VIVKQKIWNNDNKHNIYLDMQHLHMGYFILHFIVFLCCNTYINVLIFLLVFLANHVMLTSIALDQKLSLPVFYKTF
jgi:hypothetical protein